MFKIDIHTHILPENLNEITGIFSDPRYLILKPIGDSTNTDGPDAWKDISDNDFIAGANDWGVYQRPGIAERMNGTICTKMVGFHLISGAGHWVQQEKPDETCDLLLKFLNEISDKNN